MAGIGFELVTLLKKNSYSSLLRAYSLSTLISAGPGLFIMFSLGIVCFFSLFTTPTAQTVQQFLSIIIYLFSGSMIISSFFQYTFFRFVADATFLKQFNTITPNFLGVLFLQLLLSTSFSLPVVFYFFSIYSNTLKIIIISAFIILSMIWIATVLLTGFKSYRRIVWAFVVGYTSMIIMHFMFEQQQHDLIFLLFEFLVAQCILFAFLLHAIIDFYPTNRLIQFDFLKKENLYYTLVFANFFYNLGFWIDKYLFWYNSYTGYTSFSPLRSSPAYDIPMFIASLTIIPGASVFILHMESQFSLIFPKIMQTIFKQKTLAEINTICNDLVRAGQETLYRLMKTQAIVDIILVLFALFLFSIVHILPIYLNILFILVLGASFNVILWALLNMLYYMTNYRHALYVSFIFVISNFFFTLASLHAGPLYYGYGFSCSSLLAMIVALLFLNKDFKNIQYTAFMMTD